MIWASPWLASTATSILDNELYSIDFCAVIEPCVSVSFVHWKWDIQSTSARLLCGWYREKCSQCKWPYLCTDIELAAECYCHWCSLVGWKWWKMMCGDVRQWTEIAARVWRPTVSEREKIRRSHIVIYRFLRRINHFERKWTELQHVLLANKNRRNNLLFCNHATTHTLVAWWVLLLYHNRSCLEDTFPLFIDKVCVYSFMISGRGIRMNRPKQFPFIV